jgi:ribosomal protein L37AE/L43A
MNADKCNHDGRLEAGIWTCIRCNKTISQIENPAIRWVERGHIKQLSGIVQSIAIL